MHQEFIDFFMKFIPYATQNVKNQECQQKLKYLNVILKKLKEKDDPKIQDLTGIFCILFK